MAAARTRGGSGAETPLPHERNNALAKPVEFSALVGPGAFGDLTRPDGRRVLIETVRMTERDAVAVDLSTGDRVLFPYDDCRRLHLFAEIPADAAAERAGMPPPVTLQVGDMHRRTDPFHSERHLSRRFRAITTLVARHRLPCSFGLVMASLGPLWDGAFVDAHVDDPGRTAADVAERLAREPALTVGEALHAQLLEDIALPDARAHELLDAVGWSAVLARIDDHLLDAASDLIGGHGAPGAPARPEPAQSAGAHEQLSLL